MKISGSGHGDGLTLIGDNFQVRARVMDDWSVKISSKPADMIKWPLWVEKMKDKFLIGSLVTIIALMYRIKWWLLLIILIDIALKTNHSALQFLHAKNQILDNFLGAYIIAPLLFIIGGWILWRHVRDTSFRWHSVEHMVINCYESGMPLTIVNVLKSDWFHQRCGSLLVLYNIPFVIAFSFLYTNSNNNILFVYLYLFIIDVFSLEWLKFAQKNDNRFVNSVERFFQGLFHAEPYFCYTIVGIQAMEELLRLETSKDS